MLGGKLALSVAAGGVGHALGRLLGTEHPARLPTIATNTHAVKAGGNINKENGLMGLILLEALLALVVLVGIVWWTMFSGRSKGELPAPKDTDKQPKE
jgi:hypothetical protein